MLLAKEIMNTNVFIINADKSIVEAARVMQEHNSGCLPVESHNRLVGMLTDRDIVTRAVTTGRKLDHERVRSYMSPGIKYCFDDESVENISETMSKFKFRRLPVLNRNKDLVGIITISDMSKYLDTKSLVYETLHKISA